MDRVVMLGLATIVGVVGMSSCASAPARVNPASDVGPQLSVERFLQATSTRDLDAMGRLFGTADGPLGDTGSTFGCAFKKIGSWFGGEACRNRQEVELRMDAIASILQHDDYQIMQQQMVAGREYPTARVLVDLIVDQRRITGVPFVVVHGGDGQWFVEQIDLQRAMSGF